jgi:putative drug exporter of the RND superfamily
MLMVGKANWWLPAWLERLLPRLNVEGSVESAPVLPAVPERPAASEIA